MPLFIIDALESIQVGKNNSHGSWLLLCHNPVDTVIHHVTVLDARQRIDRTHHLELVHKHVACNLGRNKECRHFKRFLDFHHVIDIEVKSPHIAQQIIAMPKREKDNTIDTRKFQERTPNRILQTELRHITLIFHDNTGTARKRIWPGFRNGIETVNVARHREDLSPLANRFRKNRAFTFFGIGKQDTAVIRTANHANVFHDFLKCLLDIARATQLDASIQHVGSGIRRKVRHCRRIRLGSHVVTIDTEPYVFTVGIQRKQEHVQPKAHHVEIDIGMYRLVLLYAAETVVLEIRIFRETHLVRRTRYKRMVRQVFNIGTVRLVTGNNADIPIRAIRTKLHGQHAGFGRIVRQNLVKIHNPTLRHIE